MDPAQPGGQQPQQPGGQQPFPPQPVPPGQPHPAYQPYQQFPQYQQFPPYPIPPVAPPVNGFSIASLVSGIVCCLPPLGLVLGLVAFSQIKKKNQRGKGLAVAGTVLSAIATLLVTVGLLSGAAGDLWNGFKDGVNEAARSRPVTDLRQGDCFNAPGSGEPKEETYQVEIVTCEDPHEAEVSGTFQLTAYDRYPGEAVLGPVAERRCEDIEFSYAMDPWEIPATVEPYYYLPTPEGWKLGDRGVTCGFGTVKGDRTRGSVRRDESDLDGHQLAYLKAETGVVRTAFEQPEDDFPQAANAYRAWARVTSGALTEGADALRTYGFAPGPAELAAQRAGEFDQAARNWDKAAAAEDEDTFWDHVLAAEEALDVRTETAIRKLLDLKSTPPGPDTRA
ncbi:DUF4190 domain-containing protein [Streptomyces sp. NPDC051018]|uniref:DUF4190 domain-containing protein n=1 Tax=Streptomyces sp. NPDC051018 TaxID=3365639 RepID=UPI0037953060